ncbi:MAG: hypothetical protein WBO90_02735, partial [Blautia wexlerae]
FQHTTEPAGKPAPERFSYAFQSPLRRVFDKSFCHPIDHRRKALISVNVINLKAEDIYSEMD